MEPGFPEKSWAAPALKLSHPYKQLWGLGQDDMAIPTKYCQSFAERPLTPLANVPPGPWKPQSRDDILDLVESEVGSFPAAQGSITIPRPQGRKTPEVGIVPPPPPPAPRSTKQQAVSETSSTCLLEDSNLASALLPETFTARNIPLAAELRQPADATEMLQPVKVKAEAASHDSDFLLALLDPLKAGSGQDVGLQPRTGRLLESPSASPAAAGLPSRAGDLAPFAQPQRYPPSVSPCVQASLNPFVQAGPTPLPLALATPPRSSFVPSLGHAYSSSFITSNASFCQSQRPPPTPLTLSMPNLFAQSPATPLQSQPPAQSIAPHPAQFFGPSKIHTLPLAHSASRIQARARLTARPRDLPLVSPQGAKLVKSALHPCKPQETKDPFEDLLTQTKQEVSVTPGKVEQLRKQWETFE